MRKRSRFASLRARMSLILLGVSIGIIARWMFGSGQDTPPVFQPIPAEYRERHANDDFLEDQHLGQWSVDPVDLAGE